MSTSESPNFTKPSSCSDFGFHQPSEPTDAPAPVSSDELNPWDEVRWIASPFSDISDISVFRKSVWLAVERLYLASKLAADCDCERKEFSVKRDELSQMDLRREELKWLLLKNVIKEIECVVDPQESDSYPANASRFSADAMFIITDLGIELVEQCLSAAKVRRTEGHFENRQAAPDQRELQPSWDGERHELRCGGQVVKKFKWRASNQETILSAFEEEGWPAHIDDPLPQAPGIDPRRRLADAIKSLNRHQKVSLVRFCGDGTGQGVLWELK